MAHLLTSEGMTTMLYASSHDPLYVQQHLCELRARAALDRVGRQINRARQGDRPQTWRRRVGGLLIAAGETLVGLNEAAGCPCGSVECCR